VKELKERLLIAQSEDEKLNGLVAEKLSLEQQLKEVSSIVIVFGYVVMTNARY